MRWIKVILWVLLGLFVLFAGLAAYVSYSYEDILKKTVISSSNAFLKTPVEVSSIEVTSWRKFPYISLVFNDVLIHDDTPEQDSLIFAQHVFLNFNVYDIYQGDYSIRNIEIEKATGNFVTDKRGKENYIFWKTPDADTSSNSFALNLERVLFSDVSFSYSNHEKDIDIDLQTQKLVFDGDFLPDKLRMYINGTLDKTSAQIAGTTYLKENVLGVQTGLFVNNETSRFDFVSTNLLLDNSFRFLGNGWFNDNHYEIKLQSDNLNYESILKYVGEETRDRLSQYDARGNFDINLSLGGQFSGRDRPGIEAAFDIHNALIKERETGYTIESLSAKGSYSRPPNGADKLELSSFKGTLGSGQFEGLFSAKDLSNPYVKLDIKGTADLAEWKAFFNWSEFSELEGRIKLNALYTGRIKSIENYTLPEIKALKSSGTLTAENVTIKRANTSLVYRDFSGHFNLRNNELEIKQLIGIIKGQKVRAKGRFANVFPFILFEKERLKIKANIESDSLNINQLLSESEESQEEVFSFPQDIDLLLKVYARYVSYDNFKAENVSTNVRLTEGELIAQDAHFEGLEGEVEGKLIIKEDESGFTFFATSKMTQVNVKELLYQFNGFGQEEIKPENISGTAQIEGQIKARMDRYLSLNPHSVTAQADFSILNGQLTNYQTLQTISDYFKENVILKRVFKADELSEKLKDVHFYKIENQLLVKNDTLYLPQMHVESNILGLDIRGKHSFTNWVDYRVSLNVRDYFHRGKTNNSEFGMITDDGTGGKRVFLMITGDLNDPDISFDKESKRAHQRDLVEDETKQIKAALKGDLGLFKNDTSLRNVDEPTDPGKGDFEVQWEEEESGSDQGSSPSSSKDNEDTSRKKRPWIKNLLKENEREKSSDFQFKEDDF